ncbi:MAG: hypoxanthine phosphoribosyltransferase [Acidimicrobiia bacterium]|nr:hypoxanthine phosphoribosyltransferase [Acidimicrobiia bacterium]
MTEPVVEVITASSIRSRISELGSQITVDFDGKAPILVAVLHGALPFLADLVREIDTPLDVDFLALSRFGEGGRVRIAMDTLSSLESRNVIIVEDIVDTGLTLNVLRRMIEMRDVASLSTAALIDKSSRRLVETPLEYRGFEVGDEFLLGYGMDWEGRFRNLSSIWAVLDLPAFAQDPSVLNRLELSRRGDSLTS